MYKHYIVGEKDIYQFYFSRGALKVLVHFISNLINMISKLLFYKIDLKK